MRRRRHSNRRRKNRTVRNIAITCFVVTLLFATGYSAFQTVISINAKGNIKDLKQEVDSKVPTNDLLFWGQADNSENSLTILKDKSSHANDGILNGFDNTSTSGFYNDELIFDGINDYVDIGYANYDFNNSVSFVIYTKLNPSNKIESFFNNWEGAGSGIRVTADNRIGMATHDGTNYVWIYSDVIRNDKYYSIVATYGNNTVKLYIDGILASSQECSSLNVSPAIMAIGANPPSYQFTGAVYELTNMYLKEAMLYDRELSTNEISTITDGFERKYKKNTTN